MEDNEIRLFGGARGGGKSRRIRADDDGFYSVYSPFEVSAHRSHAMHFKIKLFGPIIDATQFSDAIEVFQAAGDGDLVEVHLSTPGGSLDATDTFLQAMHECDGRVIVRATGGVHSAGSIILMNAPEFTLSKNFNSLIHNGSTGNGGDLNKFAAGSKFSVDHMTAVLRETYEGFLTPDELNAMIDGKDFWIKGEEWMRRWHQRQEYFKAKAQLQDGPAPAPRPRKRKNSQE
jgi:ATP-dependent protease ClpP protease subunit